MTCKSGSFWFERIRGEVRDFHGARSWDWRAIGYAHAATRSCARFGTWTDAGRPRFEPNHCWMIGRSNPGPQARCVEVAR